MLAALQRIGVDAERAPSSPVAVVGDALAQRLGVVARGSGGAREGLQDRDRQAGVLPGV